MIHETIGDHSFVIQRNDLTHEKSAPPPTDFDNFPSLSCALGALELESHENIHEIAAVEAQPWFVYYESGSPFFL